MTTRGALILLRHAQSQWNLEKRYTGWGDPSLTAEGEAEAQAAGRALAARGLRFERAYCSLLTRTRETLAHVLEALQQHSCPVIADWRLNERHYGTLEGYHKPEMAALHGEAQLKRWREDPTACPPALDPDDARHPCKDPRYAQVLDARLPGAESLADAQRRVIGFWEETVRPRLHSGENVLVVSHNNTLRTLVCHIEALPLTAIGTVTFPTARALAYRVDTKGNLVRAD
jgi:2,3-bisphosphoglycerate-dependent phosphoglycerate mutase